MNDVSEKEKLVEGIRSMKLKLEELKIEKVEKSQSSFSIMAESQFSVEQIKMEN